MLAAKRKKKARVKAEEGRGDDVRQMVTIIAIVLGSWFIFGRGSNYSYSMWESILYLLVFPAVLAVVVTSLQGRRRK